MNTCDTFVNLPLSKRPKIKQTGLGEHGIRECEGFILDGYWQLHLYFWTGSLQFNNNRYPINPNMVTIIPPCIYTKWHFPDDKCIHYYVHFELEGSRQIASLPIVKDIVSSYTEISNMMETIAKNFSENSLRSEICLWELLWKLNDMEKNIDAPMLIMPGFVQTAQAIINSEYSSNINIRQIAKRIGISPTHLNRVFKSYFNKTPAEALAQKRTEKAKELLLGSNLPIRNIARRVGIPDPQHFNKFIRKRVGCSPKSLRG